MTPISVCAICKNEEKNIERFLKSIKEAFGGYPYELVIVDTGSTDGTLDIVQKYTDTVYHFDWIRDFAAARNYAIACAKNDWILFLDCDEMVMELDTSCFDKAIKQFPEGVGMMKRHNHYEMNGGDSVYVDEVERFFDRKLFHYEGIIHEQVRRLDSVAYERVAIPLVVDHCGYAGTEEELYSKAMRDKELLLEMLSEKPDDPYLYFQIGQCYNMIHDDENAAKYYGKGLEYDLDPSLEYVQMMVIAYGYNLIHLERYEEALGYQGIYDEFATSADFVCLMGLIYLRTGNAVQAMAEFLKATSFDTAKTVGANSFIPNFNMGCINEVLGDLDTARILYEKCGDFPPAIERLAAMKA